MMVNASTRLENLFAHLCVLSRDFHTPVVIYRLGRPFGRLSPCNTFQRQEEYPLRKVESLKPGRSTNLQPRRRHRYLWVWPSLTSTHLAMHFSVPYAVCAQSVQPQNLHQHVGRSGTSTPTEVSGPGMYPIQMRLQRGRIPRSQACMPCTYNPNCSLTRRHRATPSIGNPRCG